MDLSICSLASGSSGNCYAVASDSGLLLVDAGISARRITEGLKRNGFCTQVDGLLVTHEHSDHIKGIAVLAKKNVPVYANEKTLKALWACGVETGEVRVFETGSTFTAGGITVETFPVSHDCADPVGFAFCSGAKRAAIITDTGVVTDEIFRQMVLADILVLESNHDESVLRVGRYPWFLKQRILGERGHLSNDAAACALAEAVLESEPCHRNKQVLLAHLSKENNFPEMAAATMENVLRAHGISPRDVSVDILPRSEPGPVYEI